MSRQTSVQSTKSVNSVITPLEVSESLSSAIGVTTPKNGSLSRTSSVKRADSLISQNSANGGGSGDQEPLIEQIETTDLEYEM